MNQERESKLCPSCGYPSYAGHGPGCAEEFCLKIENAISSKDKEIPLKEIQENREGLRNLSEIPQLLTQLEETYIRTGIFDKIERIHRKLQSQGLGIKVFDGWRSPEKQAEARKLAIERVKKEKPEINNPQEIEALASKYAAPIEFAPHCTGGAIDLTIYDLTTGEELDMGTKFDDFREGSYTEHPLITGQAKDNRKILKKLMEEEGFFNFPTEWWHFSFGNVEWATYMDKPQAIYGPISLETNK